MPLTPEEQEEKELLQQLLVKRGARQGTVLDKIPIYKDPYSAATGGPATTIGDLVRSTPDILQGIATAGGTIVGGSVGGGTPASIPLALAGGALGSAAGTVGRDYLTETFPSVFGEKRKPIIEFTGNNIADEAIFDTLLNTVTAGMGKLGPVKEEIGKGLGLLKKSLPQESVNQFNNLRNTFSREELPNVGVGIAQTPEDIASIRAKNAGVAQQVMEKLAGPEPITSRNITENQAQGVNSAFIRKQKPVKQAEDLTTVRKPLNLFTGTATDEQVRGANAVIKIDKGFRQLESNIADIDDLIQAEKDKLLAEIPKNLPKATSKFAQKATVKVPEVAEEELKSFNLTKLQTQRNALERQLNEKYPEELRQVLRTQSSQVMDKALRNPDFARQLVEVGGKQEVREQGLAELWKRSYNKKGDFDANLALKEFNKLDGLNSEIFQGKSKAQIREYLTFASTVDNDLGKMGKNSLWWVKNKAYINLGASIFSGFAAGPTKAAAVSGGIVLSDSLFRKLLLNPQVSDAARGLAKARPGSKEALDYMRRIIPYVQGSKVGLFRRNPDGSTEITDPNFIIPSTKRGER